MASVHTILYRLKYVIVVVHTLVVLAYLVHSCLLGELSIHKIHTIEVKAYNYNVLESDHNEVWYNSDSYAEFTHFRQG